MKNIKKLLVLLVAVMMLVSLSACGKDKEEAGEKTMDLEAAEVEENTSEESTSEATNTATLEEIISAYYTEMPDHIYKIGQKDFADRVIAGDDMVILDIRSADDYAAGHVKGAVNLPWGTAISDNLNKISQDDEVMIYCYSGQTAGQAVMTLNAAGINARSVNLGWNFGISKVDGIEAITETDVNEFGSDTYEVSEEVQTALDAYYSGLADVSGTTYGNYKVSEDNLKAMIEAGDDFYLLSVRGADDYAANHIEGAANVPFGKDQIVGLTNVPKDKKVVVYCYSGQTAGQTTAAMRLLGYDAVSLNGGMGVESNSPLGWSNKGFEVVSSSAVYNSVIKYFAEMPDHIYKIGQADFVERVVAGDDMVILDIRSADDYAAGHVKGAVNLPWGTAISDNLNKISQDDEVMIYCYSGQTAGQAVMTLNAAGINARSVNLGWNFGISKVDGVDTITETDVNEFGADTYDVNEEIQAALDTYYAGLADVAGTTYGNYKISEDNLAAMIEMEDDFFLLSLRSAEDFEKGHIVGAVNAPFGKEQIAGLAAVPMDQKVVVYCYSGQTAGQTTAAMKLLGYDVVSLNGGAGVGSNAPIGWTNKGYELVTK